MDKITNNFFHSQTNSTTELGHSPPFLDLSRKLLVKGFLIMINYIYIQLYNLQGWFVMVSDCEELVGVNSLYNLGIFRFPSSLTKSINHDVSKWASHKKFPEIFFCF